jgi:hypothetical protein
VREVLLRFGASRPAHVRTGEWWRFATALFVHIGPRHLLGNMATLLVLGPALVAALGPWRFLVVYLASGVAGNALSYAVTPPDVVSAGASGAILGVLGALGGQRLRFAASARYRGLAGDRGAPRLSRRRGRRRARRRHDGALGRPRRGARPRLVDSAAERDGYSQPAFLKRQYRNPHAAP